MEQRIKIVWIFSIASILLITCGQVYWLRNQYQYMNDEQINGIYDCILQTTQQYASLSLSSVLAESCCSILRVSIFFWPKLSKSRPFRTPKINSSILVRFSKSMVFMIASCRPPNSMTLSVLPNPKR